MTVRGKKKALGWLHGEQAPTGAGAPDVQEERMVEDFGGEVHKRSGAGMVKHDGHNDLMWWDAKHTDGRSISLPISFLDHLYDQAMARGKLATVELEFSQARGEVRWYLIPWADFMLERPGKSFTRPALGSEARDGAKTASVGLTLCQGLSEMCEDYPDYVPAIRFLVERAIACTEWALITRKELDALLERRERETF